MILSVLIKQLISFRLELSPCPLVMKPESPGPRQTSRLPPTATGSSPAYSMSVIIIILTALAAAVFFTIILFACRRRRKQWRNRKRWDANKRHSFLNSYMCPPLYSSIPLSPQSYGDPHNERSSLGAPAGSTPPQPYVPAGSPAAKLKAAGARVSP